MSQPLEIKRFVMCAGPGPDTPRPWKMHSFGNVVQGVEVQAVVSGVCEEEIVIVRACFLNVLGQFRKKGAEVLGSPVLEPIRITLGMV